MLAGESAGSSRWASLSAARLFLRKQLWIWPLLAAVMLFAVGYWLRHAVDRSLKESLESQLRVVLDADVAALMQWFRTQETNVAAAAKDDDVRAAAQALIEFSDGQESALAIAQSEPLKHLKSALEPWLGLGDYEDFIIVDSKERIIGSPREELVGKRKVAEYDTFLSQALAGEVLVSRPFRSVVMMPDDHGRLRTGVATMFACAPVRSSEGKVIAALAFRLDPDEGFTSVLQLARPGKSGETYAFDKSGLMLSHSRFDEDLKDVGLLPDTDDAESELSVELRDPGANLMRGERPTASRSKQPRTLPAIEASVGRSGVGVDGHRDYRGVPQAGAWTWLDKYQMGVNTQMDYDEAMAPRRILDFAFWTMFGLLVAMSLAIVAFSFILARLQQRMQKESLKLQKLGQYQLEEKLGEGGMGVVYRGKHAMLRRPTAIKLLDLKKINDASIARFEREVQLTSQLSHPNTIAIYDYGRTPEGIFYYAMEYLDGLDLERLVERYGSLPEGRVIHILLQVCGSLAEAHAMGLVHRDIKPANIIVGHRAGMADFVKVLDFGLVKALDTERMKTLTAADSITGTPMYIAPEGIEKPNEVDARSDLYAVGAVGYFLLTAKQPFDAENIVELCMKVVNSEPETPSHRLGKPVSSDLEAVITRLLAKKQSERFASADELAEALRHCTSYGAWSNSAAESWWKAHTERKFSQSSMPTPGANADTRTMVWAADESPR